MPGFDPQNLVDPLAPYSLTPDLSPFDTIFHLANIANDPAVELNPYASWDVNVLATMRLADRAARQGVTQMVFASSGSVYGVTPEPRVTEETSRP